MFLKKFPLYQSETNNALLEINKQINDITEKQIDLSCKINSIAGDEFNKYKRFNPQAGKGMLIVFAISLIIFIIQLN
jgi:hypothetical protein